MVLLSVWKHHVIWQTKSFAMAIFHWISAKMASYLELSAVSVLKIFQFEILFEYYEFYQIISDFLALAVQLDKHTVGYLTYNAGLQSSVSCVLEHGTEKQHLLVTCCVGIPHSFVSASYTKKLIDYELKLRLAAKWVNFEWIIESRVCVLFFIKWICFSLQIWHIRLHGRIWCWKKDFKI